MHFEGICYYPGAFTPPTKFHFTTAAWLSRREQVTDVKIVIGNDSADGIDQDKKVKLWHLLFQADFTANITLERAKTTPLLSVYNILKAKPETPLYIAIDETSVRKDEFKKHFNDFPNAHIQLIPSQFAQSSQQMLKAIAEDNLAAIKALLPDDMPEDAIQEYIKILKPVKPETSTEEMKESCVNNIVDFLNEVLSLNEATSEFAKLKKNKVPLTAEERDEVMKAKAVWHSGPNGEATPAVWKSKDKKTGKITYITHTHRAWNKAASLKSCINKYHNFIKGTS